MAGLYPKYEVTKADGTTDEDAVYFVLRLDTDHFARTAVGLYAALIETDNPELASDLRADLEMLKEA